MGYIRDTEDGPGYTAPQPPEGTKAAIIAQVEAAEAERDKLLAASTDIEFRGGPMIGRATPTPSWRPPTATEGPQQYVADGQGHWNPVAAEEVPDPRQLGSLARLNTFLMENYPHDATIGEPAAHIAIRILGDHLSCLRQAEPCQAAPDRIDPRNLPDIIGLSGKAQSGKGTIANFLVENFGYIKVSLADKLREALLVLDPILAHDGNDPFDEPEVRYSSQVAAFGYERTKAQFAEARRLLQVLGTEVGRNILGQDVWVNALLNSLEPGKKYVIDDVRFPNEMFAVDNRGGFMLRVERPGAGLPGAAGLHESETALDDWDFEFAVLNNGDVSELEQALSTYILPRMSIAWMEQEDRY